LLSPQVLFLLVFWSAVEITMVQTVRAQASAEPAQQITTQRIFPNCGDRFVAAPGSYRFVRVREPVVLPPGDYRVGEIHYTRLPVFDENNPDEDRRIYRWGNRFHSLTREHIVAQQVLFESGEQFDARVLEETQRLLRDQGYFFDADIRAYKVCGEQVDIEVITRDSWSFTPSLDFDRQGGENNFSIGLRDSNIFGLGNELAIATSQDIDRRSEEFFYGDNNVWGTRLRNRTRFVDSDDGSTQSFDLGLPFFELDSKQSWRVALSNDERVDELFFRGEEFADINHETELYSAEFGWSRGLVNGYARRWSLGYGYRSDRFSDSGQRPPPLRRPVDRELSFPYLRYESVEDNFVTALNFNQIYLTEDILLGSYLSARIGLAAEAFGSDQDRLLLEARYSNTLHYDDDELWQHEIQADGFWNRKLSDLEDFVLHYENRYLHRQKGSFAFFASLEASWSRNLNPNRQLFMGGVAGARAFDNRLQAGDRSFVISLEERYYSDLHLFNLIRVGAAVFADVGRAWASGVDDGLEDDYLSNVGFGLRLGSSKSASARMAHIDFAIPLTNRDDPIVDNFQISVEFKGAF
jgi:outer membrane protein assembly factor BamA